MNGNRLLRASVTALSLLLVGLFGACSDAQTPLGPSCGDGICSTDEDPQGCSRDCSYACVPNTTRCEGNAVVTCLDDGLHEVADPCAPGEYCTAVGCSDSPNLATDTGSALDTGSADLDSPDMGDDQSDPDAEDQAPDEAVDDDAIDGDADGDAADGDAVDEDAVDDVSDDADPDAETD